MIQIETLFDRPKIIGIIGNVNTAKSNLIYHIVETLRKNGRFNLYCYGLHTKVDKSRAIYSINEMEQIKNSIIILDEVMSLWDLDNRMAKRQIENTLRLINHNNNILVISMLPENVRKFISGKLDVVIYKKVTIADFVNGSSVKRILLDYKGIERGTSVLELEKHEAIIFDGLHYHKINIPYYVKYDSKKNNPQIVSKNVNESVKESVKEKNPLKNVKVGEDDSK